MRSVVAGSVWAMAAGLTLGSVAELKNMEVGGQIVVYGTYYTNITPADDGLRIPASWLRGRPVGTGLDQDIFSGFAFDRDGVGSAGVAQWTRLNVKADFSGGVSTYIEFDHIADWGTAFRSNYVTGVDAGDVGSVNLYQAYLEANEMFGLPLSIRLGRQEMRLGNEWLVGGNDNGPAPAWGLSFDGVRLTYRLEDFTLDAWTFKLFDDRGAEADGDTDFYGIYGSYTGIEDVTLDAYWMYLRDGSSPSDTESSLAVEGLEDIFGVDGYSPTRLHTVGLRGSATFGPWDLEAEVAYQFGDASHTGALFRPVFYGDDRAEYDNLGMNFQLGYSLDVAWDPRVFVAFTWFEGEDKREITALDWAASLIDPFYTRAASISFNRLFSNAYYSIVLDGTDLSNVYVFQAGMSFQPAEKVEVAFGLEYLLADETFGRPRFFLFPFWTEDTDDELGLEFDLSLTYDYSDDLYISVGWEHLFVGAGLEGGNFNNGNGLEFNGGSNGDDVDFVYFETGIFF